MTLSAPVRIGQAVKVTNILRPFLSRADSRKGRTHDLDGCDLVGRVMTVESCLTSAETRDPLLYLCRASTGEQLWMLPGELEAVRPSRLGWVGHRASRGKVGLL